MMMSVTPPMALGQPRRSASVASVGVASAHDLSSYRNDGADGKRRHEPPRANCRTPPPPRDARDEEETPARSGEKKRAAAAKDDGALKNATSKKGNPMEEDRMEDRLDGMIGKTISLESSAEQKNKSSSRNLECDDLTFASKGSTAHRLLEQQAFLKNAPIEVQKEYYVALSEVALLNAEAETRKAELELRRIELEKKRIGTEKLCIEASANCGGLDFVRDTLEEFRDYVANELFENTDGETMTCGGSTLATADRSDGGSTFASVGESTSGGDGRAKKKRGIKLPWRRKRSGTATVGSKGSSSPAPFDEGAPGACGDFDGMNADTARAKLERVTVNIEASLADAAKTEAAIVTRQDELRRNLEEMVTLSQILNWVKADVTRAEKDQSRVAMNLTRGLKEVKAMQEELRRVLEEPTEAK